MSNPTSKDVTDPFHEWVRANHYSYSQSGGKINLSESAVRALFDEVVRLNELVADHEEARRRAHETTCEWRPMETALKDRPILGLCSHAADPGPSDTGRLTPYMAHAEGLSHVEDGPHVLVWGGEYQESDWEAGINVHIPNWWFRSDSDFEVAANPIGWMPVPALKTSGEPT
jgi:hypothetical protein